METVEHQDGRTVWACYDCGGPTEHEAGEFEPLEECLCPECQEWHQLDREEV